MATKTNTFEGVPDNDTITIENSGGVSGDAFTSVVIGGTGQIIAQNDNVGRGTRAMSITPQSGFATYVVWSVVTSTQITGRFLVHFTGFPDAYKDIIRLRNAGLTATRASIGVLPSGAIRVNDTTGTAIWDSTGVMTPGWYEFVVILNTPTATTGTLDLSVYTGKTAASPTTNLSVALTGRNFGTGGVANVVQGVTSSSGTIDTITFDDIQWSEQTLVAPSRLVDPVEAGAYEWQLATGSGWEDAVLYAL